MAIVRPFDGPQQIDFLPRPRALDAIVATHGNYATVFYAENTNLCPVTTATSRYDREIVPVNIKYSFPHDAASKDLSGHGIHEYGEVVVVENLSRTTVEAGEGPWATRCRACRLVLLRGGAVVEGFETPYGLELLSTVHWANQDIASTDVEAVTEYVREWTPRKGEIFTRDHVARALKHLSRQGLLRAA